MKNSQILIFTDLDGSLLNHNNFEFKELGSKSDLLSLDNIKTKLKN